MYGAILGDIIGAPYEFDASEKVKEYFLFSKRSVRVVQLIASATSLTLN